MDNNFINTFLIESNAIEGIRDGGSLQLKKHAIIEI